MRFFCNLHKGSSTGICGGDLRLYFTTENAADWKSPSWIPPTAVNDTIVLPSGDTLYFDVNPVTGSIPGYLYLYGTIKVVTKAGVQVGTGRPIGQGTVTFQPGTPVNTFSTGADKASGNGLTWDIGYELAAPFDGASADCQGHWWALWH